MNAPAALPEYLMPRDIDAVGPQNPAEQRLYDLIMESVNGPPAQETSVAELIAELQARVQARRYISAGLISR
jgi:hypothetical protein